MKVSFEEKEKVRRYSFEEIPCLRVFREAGESLTARFCYLKLSEDSALGLASQMVHPASKLPEKFELLPEGTVTITI